MIGGIDVDSIVFCWGVDSGAICGEGDRGYTNRAMGNVARRWSCG